MVERTNNDVLYTYRYLRVAMPLLGVVLGAAVVRQIYQTDPHCFLGSISAYYYTSARAAFVACLCTIGAALIIYHGNSAREDVTLNVSGFLAFVVAFVPTPLKDLDVKPGDAMCRLSNVPQEQQLVKAIENNIFALLVGATAMVLLAVWFWFRAPAARVAGLDTRALAGSALGVGAAWYVLWGQPQWTRQHAHLWSAIALFAGIVLVILMNALGLLRGSAPRPKRRYEVIYQVVAAIMVVLAAGLGILALAGSKEHTVFWLETVGISGFVVFWAVQTTELWYSTSRGRTIKPTPAPDTVAAPDPNKAA